MERNEIIKKLNSIFCDVFDLELVVLNDSTCSDDIEEWDSLSHIQLVYAIEREFNIKFTSNEILSWKNVSDMVDGIDKRREA